MADGRRTMCHVDDDARGPEPNQFTQTEDVLARLLLTKKIPRPLSEPEGTASLIGFRTESALPLRLNSFRNVGAFFLNPYGQQIEKLVKTENRNTNAKQSVSNVTDAARFGV